MPISRHVPWLAAAAFLALSVAVSAGNQESKSATVAKELAQALDAAKMDSIAAVDPADPNSFVAALYFQGSQLLVVSAKYSVPQLLNAKITSKEFRDVYIDLQSASVAGSKIFVQDMLADGLAVKPDGDKPADSWEQGNKTVAFDGEWKKAKMAEADYLKTYGEADEKYAAMLSVLLSKAKAARSGS
jgi:hypothetical protein